MNKSPAADDFIALRFMKEFKCIGGDCEDTCCSGWRLSLTRRDYSNIRKRMANGRLQQFKELVNRNPEDGPDGEFAYIELNEKGNCGFLDCDSLCSLQREFGSGILPRICAVYPRIVSMVGSRVELAGSLSCPEAARKCLLSSDAVDLVDSSPEDLPLQQFNRLVNVDADDPYIRYFDDIRSVLYQLLTLKEFDFQTRLHFCSYFARSTAAFFGDGNAGFTEAKLSGAIESISEPATLLELADKFGRLDVPTAIAGTVIEQALGARLQKMPSPAFRSLLNAACRTYLHGDETSVDLDGIWRTYNSRVEFWTDRRRIEIDQYFTNFSVTHVMAHPYVTWPDLSAYMRQLIVRNALLRFMLFSDPKLLECQQRGEAPADLLDRTAVRVFYLFAKSIEHNFTFLTDLEEALDEQGYNSFAHLVCLTRF